MIWKFTLEMASNFLANRSYIRHIGLLELEGHFLSFWRPGMEACLSIARSRFQQSLQITARAHAFGLQLYYDKKGAVVSTRGAVKKVRQTEVVFSSESKQQQI